MHERRANPVSSSRRPLLWSLECHPRSGSLDSFMFLGPTKTELSFVVVLAHGYDDVVPALKDFCRRFATIFSPARICKTLLHNQSNFVVGPGRTPEWPITPCQAAVFRMSDTENKKVDRRGAKLPTRLENSICPGFTR